MRRALAADCLVKVASSKAGYWSLVVPAYLLESARKPGTEYLKF